MNRFYTIFAALLLSGLFFLIPSCKNERKYKIGVSQCADDAWRSKMNDEIKREVLFHDNIEVEIRSADDSNDKQMADLRHFVAESCDLIIAAPNEASALTPLLDSIYTSGTPVIIMDRGITNNHFTAFQGADNFGIGVAAANYARSIVKSPKVIELLGNMRTTPARDRRDGFHSVAVNSNDFEIISSAEAGWTLERAEKVADSILKLHPEANLIYAHNDNMAIGASRSAKKIGRNDIKIIGIDASPHIGIQAVKDSVIDATFVYPTQGRQIVATAIAILEGKPYRKFLAIPSKTAVDLSNAEIMLDQDKALKVETDNIKDLKSKLDFYWKQHNTQTWFLYGAAIILLLTVFVLFLLLRGFWAAKRHRTEIEAQNVRLREQRDEIEQQNVLLRNQHQEINKMVGRVEEATQSKLAFFTSVSHDLRTPLTLIAEPVDQLSKASNLSQAQHDLALLANKNVRILMRLINQILDFRKYENGTLDLFITEYDLAADINDWAGNFRELARKKHIHLKVSIATSSLMMAYDREKMERVLFNLLSNAFKFSMPNSSVFVSLESRGGEAIITVTDSGKGISPDEINRIFDYFYKSEKANSQGSGIGLALCKAFVELHGGTISVNSNEGQGATFYVSIPIRHASSSSDDLSDSYSHSSSEVISELADIEEPASLPVESEKSILIIDDNPDIRTLAASLLRDKFNVIQAANGLQGIRLATKYVPDLIICDVMMPGIDGMETCRRIKNESFTSHIPILLLTACAMEEEKVSGYSCGADAYMTKPFSSDLLLSRIDALLKNRELLQRSFAERFGPVATNQIVKEGKGKETKSLHSVESIDNKFYLNFLEIIDSKLADSELSVDQIAADMGMSRVQLYRKLKAVTNYSPTDLLKIRRLKKAEKILKTSDTTVSEVCYNVGFSSHSYFTKCFREYFGESPSDIQKRTAKIDS